MIKAHLIKKYYEQYFSNFYEKKISRFQVLQNKRIYQLFYLRRKIRTKIRRVHETFICNMWECSFSGCRKKIFSLRLKQVVLDINKSSSEIRFYVWLITRNRSLKYSQLKCTDENLISSFYGTERNQIKGVTCG